MQEIPISVSDVEQLNYEQKLYSSLEYAYDVWYLDHHHNPDYKIVRVIVGTRSHYRALFYAIVDQNDEFV